MKENIDWLKKGISTFRFYGDRPSSFPEKFSFYHVKGFLEPETSPVFLNPGEELHKEDIEYLMTYFKDHASSSYDSKLPYLSLLNDLNDPALDRANEETLKAAGWEILHDECMNIWTWARPFNLPEGLRLKITPYHDDKSKDEFAELVKEGFDVDRSVLKEMEDRFPDHLNKTYLVLLYDKEDRLLAGGSCLNIEEASFLYWVTVKKEYRRKGYWRLLLAARQVITQGEDVFWINTTSTAQVKAKGDHFFSYTTWIKSSSCT